MSRNKKVIVKLETLRNEFKKQATGATKVVIPGHIYDLSGWALKHAKAGEDVKVDNYLNHMQSACMDNKPLKNFVKSARRVYAM